MKYILTIILSIYISSANADVYMSPLLNAAISGAPTNTLFQLLLTKSGSSFAMERSVDGNSDVLINDSLSQLFIESDLRIHDNYKFGVIRFKVNDNQVFYILIRSTTDDLNEILTYYDEIRSCALGFKLGLYDKFAINHLGSAYGTSIQCWQLP